MAGFNNNQLYIIIMKGYLILLVLLIILVSGCIDSGEHYVDIDGERIAVEIARSAGERQMGLMFRESLCHDCGMLFVFDAEDFHSFWMKNTIIPLDMIFIDADLNIIDILHAVPCEEEPCEMYRPGEKALYVLETNTNRFDEKIIGKKAEITLP